jgi:hypothetical protein
MSLLCSGAGGRHPHLSSLRAGSAGWSLLVAQRFTAAIGGSFPGFTSRVIFAYLLLRYYLVDIPHPLPPLPCGIMGLGGNLLQIFEFKGLGGKIFICQ